MMYDLPSCDLYTPTARANWEATFRDALARDYSHPCIFAWILFNETWGLEEHQTPAQLAVGARDVPAGQGARPTRLVEDNSPNKYDHVLSDLNSWHFYIDNYGRARQHVSRVVAQTKRGGLQLRRPPLRTRGRRQRLRPGHRPPAQQRVRRPHRPRGRRRHLLLLQVPHHRVAPARHGLRVRLHGAGGRGVGAQRLPQLRPLAEGVRVRPLRAGDDRGRPQRGRLRGPGLPPLPHRAPRRERAPRSSSPTGTRAP